jgi:hypothetical protein
VTEPSGKERNRERMDDMDESTDAASGNLVVFEVTEDSVELLQVDDGRGFVLPRELLPDDLNTGDVLRVVARVERVEQFSGAESG